MDNLLGRVSYLTSWRVQPSTKRMYGKWCKEWQSLRESGG